MYTATKKEEKQLDKQTEKQVQQLDLFAENGSYIYHLVKQDVAERMGYTLVQRTQPQ